MRRDDDDRRRPAFCRVFWSVISFVSPLAAAVGGLVAGCSGDLGVTTVAAGAGEGWWEFFRIPGFVCQTLSYRAGSFFFFTNPWASLAYPHWDVPRSWLVDRIVHSRSFCSNNVSPEFSNFSCLSAEISQATAAVSLQLSARSGVGMMEENEVSDPYG